MERISASRQREVCLSGNHAEGIELKNVCTMETRGGRKKMYPSMHRDSLSNDSENFRIDSELSF